MTPSLSPSIVMACTMFVPLPAVKILQTEMFFLVKHEKSTGLDSLRYGGFYAMLIGHSRPTLICFFVRILLKKKIKSLKITARKTNQVSCSRQWFFNFKFLKYNITNQGEDPELDP
jgi:hypothetical protein